MDSYQAPLGVYEIAIAEDCSYNDLEEEEDPAD